MENQRRLKIKQKYFLYWEVTDQSMLIGWVDCEQNALKELFPSLTDANALCLIFGGMGRCAGKRPGLVRHYDRFLWTLGGANPDDEYDVH
jgi:hypothetical protein